MILPAHRQGARAAVLAAAVLAAAACANAATPPGIVAQDAFDASSVPPYAVAHDEVYAHIRAHRAEHLGHLQRWVRQRSISAQDDGVQAMAELLRQDLVQLGFQEAELVETDGHPGVWGWFDAGAEHTLVVYLMYDVQPIEPTGWTVDAFGGELVESEGLGQVLMARGATNQKGPERAFLNALESVLAVRGSLPVNLMVVADGEEELGSPHYPQVIDRYADRLKQAHGVFFPMNNQGRFGEVSMFLGVKGILYMELEARGNATHGGPQRNEVHGSYAAMLDSPSWRLVQALATLTTPDGEIAIPGYRDAIRAPTAEEQRLFNGLLPQREAHEAQMLDTLGASRWKRNLSVRDALISELFDTTLNIDGLVAGYTGEGVKTILPHRALAKVDSRLVPDQTPEAALALLREHLDRSGFGDIEVRKLSGYPPAQTSVETALARATIGAYRKYGLSPSVAPRIAGSAPYHVFTQRLGLPMIAGGLGHGAGAHAPNEYMVIAPPAGSKLAGLERVEDFYVDLLYALADALRGESDAAP